MSDEPKLSLNTDNETSSDDIDPDAVLGLALIKAFRLLKREERMKVIQYANQLASSVPPDAG